MYTPKISQKLECTTMQSNNFGVSTMALPFSMECPDHALQNILMHYMCAIQFFWSASSHKSKKSERWHDESYDHNWSTYLGRVSLKACQIYYMHANVLAVDGWHAKKHGVLTICKPIYCSSNAGTPIYLAC
jgi:hypothetical protein